MENITVEEYKKFIEGFHITDCVVRKRDIFYFTLKQLNENSNSSESNLTKRVLPCFLSKPRSDRWSRSVLSNFDHFLAGVSQQPIEQFVGVDLSGQVYILGGGDKAVEPSIQSWFNGGPLRGGIHKLRTIEGTLYAVGGNRTVLRRDGKNNWHGYTKDIPSIGDSDQGFEDMDGFSAKDIYCVGGTGNVFHFDGSRWQQCAFPSNRYLESVCCAGDGYVYIGAQSGYVFKGRGEQWKKIHQDNMTLGFTDMVWHQGKVWCTSDYGLWVIENDKLVAADVPPEIRACSGNLSVGDGVMLLAGMFGAAYHDGQQWHMLVDTQKMG